jgi:hypothetical protein
VNEQGSDRAINGIPGYEGSRAQGILRGMRWISVERHNVKIPPRKRVLDNRREPKREAPGVRAANYGQDCGCKVSGAWGVPAKLNASHMSAEFRSRAVRNGRP